MSVSVRSVLQSSLLERRTTDELNSPVLREGVAYWRALRGERTFPVRKDLNPRDMAALLPYMTLVNVIDGGKDFEHRIVGDILVQAFTVPVQNRRFSEIEKDAPGLIGLCYPLFREVVQKRAPVAWRHRAGYDSASVVFVDSEVVLLPLGITQVDQILGFGVHESCVAEA